MRRVSESINSQASTRTSPKRQFSLTSFREAQRIVVRACGRLILGQGADQDLWAAHVDQTTATTVALDLSCVDDVDAQGLGLLAGLVDRARVRGTTVWVMSASRVVQRLVKMAHLDQVLPGTWHKPMEFPTAVPVARAYSARRGIPACVCVSRVPPPLRGSTTAPEAAG